MTHAERRQRRLEIIKYRENHTVRETANYFGLSYNHIVQVAGGMNGKYVQSLGIKTYELIALLISSSDDLQKISNNIGLSHARVHAIYQRCVEAGIPVRSRSRVSSTSK